MSVTNTTDLAIKVASLMDLDLDERDISVSHRLPQRRTSADSYPVAFRIRRRRGFWEGDEVRAKGYGKDELPSLRLPHNPLRSA